MVLIFEYILSNIKNGLSRSDESAKAGTCARDRRAL